MLKLLLQTTILSIYFLSPAFCMDEELTHLRAQKGTSYVHLQEEALGNKAFAQGFSYLQQADEHQKAYRKYQNQELWAKGNYLIRKFPWFTTIEQKSAKDKVGNIKWNKTTKKEARLKALNQAVTFLELADQSDVPNATYGLAVAYFHLLDFDRQKYKELTFKTLSRASEKGSAEAATMLLIFGK